MSLITCHNLKIGYENRVILENINFNVENGDYVCIFGDNGSGKTTLLKTLLGLIPAVKGEVNYDTTLKTKSIGYLPQKTQIQVEFPASVYEIVLSGCLNRIGFRPFYRKKEKELAVRNMKLFGVKGLSRRPFRELSGGQQQRVLLARALCATDKILILDEPFTGLDRVTANLLYEILNKINKELNVTIIVVSHFVEDILDYADKVVHLEKENSFIGTVKEYKDRYNLHALRVSSKLIIEEKGEEPV